MNRDFDYENNNIEYTKSFIEEDGKDGEGIKCKNYIVCEEILPKWWFGCKGCYLCVGCLINRFDILKIINNVECPICLEIKEGITQPRCDHSVCISCFKRCQYGDQNREGEPIFPYPDIEDEYYDDSGNLKWGEGDYPLIKIFNYECNTWDDERIEKRENEEYLRNCPICRK